MKKTFLLLTMTLLFFIGSGAFNDVKAQTTESTVTIDGTIGNHEATTSQYVPLWNNENFSISQIFYTSDEIGKSNGDTITKIAFKVANVDAAAYERYIDIYMANCGDEYNFGVGGRSTKVIESAAVVFSGKFKYETSQKNTWITITLDTPFKYEGGNILICVNDYTNDYVISSDGCAYFDAFNCNYTLPYGNDTGLAYRVLYQGNHVDNKYDPTTSTISARTSKPVPFIQFTFKEQQQDPITLTVASPSTNITTCDTVTFKVTQGEEGTGTDVTTSATIYQVDGIETIELDGNTFVPSEAGEFTFYAKKGNVQSDTITINVTEAPYILNASSKSIWNNGEDYTTFSITQCKEEVAVDDFTFYVNGEAIYGNTFSTTEAGEYTVYAMNGTTETEEITVYASEWKVTTMIGTTDLVLEEYISKYYNTAEIYNGEFRLWVAITGDNYDNGIIINNNVYKYQLSTGVDAYMERSGHRPMTPQPLSIPESIYVESIGKITITEIDHNVFYNVFEGDDTGFYQRTGNSLNDNISSLTIPNTIKTIGINAFGFDMCDNFVITCNAETPPTLCWEVTENNENEWETPFGNYNASNPGNYGGQYNTVDGTIDGENVSTYLYVPASSLDAYKQADCWKWFYRLVADESTMIKYNGNGDWMETANWNTGAVPTENDAVIINGKVVVSTDVTIGSVTVKEDCSVTVDAEGVFRVNADIVNNGEIITIEDGGQLYYNASDDLVVTVKKGIKGYGDDDSVRDGWYAISSPVYADVENNNYYFENIENVVNLIPTEEEERKYDLYRYFEMGEYDVNTDKNVSWWENHKMDEYYDWNSPEFTTLSLGRGYLYASSEDVTLEFTNSVKSGEVLFYCTASYSGENESFIGFNLIGNPFPHNITAANIYGLEMAEAYYTLSNSGMWTSNLFSDTAEIKVGEAVLIKVIEEGDLRFSNVATRRGFVNNGSIAISVSNEKYTDNAIVSFSEGMGLNKYPHFNKEAQEVYIIDNDTKYGVATMNNDATSIEVGFKANTMGEYTIAAQTQDCKFNSMTLTDKMTGVKTNLLTDSYTFMATTNDNPNRFTLTLNADNDVDNDFIYINNNEMIINNIEGDGLVQIYDVMGRSVATYNVSGSANISMETLSNGVYVVRMTDDNGVKTQKVVNN